MGHEIIKYCDRSVRFDDMDLWAVRHFLLSEAASSGSSDLADFIQGWDWIGPGVYIGIDFDKFFNGESAREQELVKVLGIARARIQSFGEAVPLHYLEANINSPTAYYMRAVPVSRFVEVLEKLEELFTGERPTGWQFSADEISAGVYRAVGIGPGGRRVEATDIDVSRALTVCRELALRSSGEGDYKLRAMAAPGSGERTQASDSEVRR